MPASALTRCNMVYVPEGNILLSGTVHNNLLLGNPTASDAELKEALHTAVAGFVFDLPNGWDNPCGEIGAELSEGQAQRMAEKTVLLVTHRKEAVAGCREVIHIKRSRIHKKE